MKVPVYNLVHAYSTFTGEKFSGGQYNCALIANGDRAVLIARDGSACMLDKTILLSGSDTINPRTQEVYLREFLKHEIVIDEVDFSVFLQTRDQKKLNYINYLIERVGLDPKNYAVKPVTRVKQEVGRPSLGLGKMKRFSGYIAEETFNRIPEPRTKFIREAIEEKIKREIEGEKNAQ